jgi:hypothetical protein
MIDADSRASPLPQALLVSVTGIDVWIEEVGRNEPRELRL